MTSWKRDEQHPIFPVGSKPKELLIAPDQCNHAFLIPGHRYLFKKAGGWQATQAWSEVIAYEVARPLGLTVPPCFVAIDENTGDMGVLVEFFYGYPDDPSPPQLEHASDSLQNIEPQYDPKHGRPHYLSQNILLCQKFGVAGYTEWWARTLAFDALIGNTDRHPDNWGFLIGQADDGTPCRSMTPVFDNGTSLGYELAEDKVSAAWTRHELAAYIGRGRHHCSWLRESKRGEQHADLCAHFNGRQALAGTRSFELTDVEIDNIVQWCTQFDATVPFTEARAKFVSTLLKARRDALAERLGPEDQ